MASPILRSRQHNDEVQLYAFDILALDGDDLRKLPLHLRKHNLAQLLSRRADGIHLAPFEGEIGPDLFRAACDMMLEGLASKRRDSSLSRWAIARLDQSEKSEVTRNEPSEGCILVKSPQRWTLGEMRERRRRLCQAKLRRGRQSAAASGQFC